MWALYILQSDPGGFRTSFSWEQYYYPSDFFANCLNPFVVYLIACPCLRKYVGSCSHQVRIRMTEHRSRIQNMNVEALLVNISWSVNILQVTLNLWFWKYFVIKGHQMLNWENDCYNWKLIGLSNPKQTLSKVWMHSCICHHFCEVVGYALITGPQNLKLDPIGLRFSIWITDIG